jgi:hypothetical protein
MTVQAIETNYKGCNFRSRLEARWAVFFDALGVEWLYEPEGFEREWDDGKNVRYLPDFYLPETGTWVEVKGALSNNDARKLGQILDYGSPLTWFCDSSDKKECEKAFADSRIGKEHKDWASQIFQPGLLILGEIPNVDHGIVLHKLITHGKGLKVNHASFSYPNGSSAYNLHKIDVKVLYWISLFAGKTLEIEYFDGWCESDEVLNKHFSPSCLYVPTQLANTKVMEAYKKARSARFEFGENK